jgi:Mrp family chromosome partitioning ATPase
MLPDALVLGAQVGVCVFVVGRTARRRAVLQTLASLKEAGVQILGIAANEVRPAPGRYYYYYYYYYPYHQGSDRKERRRSNKHKTWESETGS